MKRDDDSIDLLTRKYKISQGFENLNVEIDVDIICDLAFMFMCCFHFTFAFLSSKPMCN